MLKVIKNYALIITALCTMGGGLIGANTQAEEPAASVPSITIRYADLNLDTAEGVEVLYSRLKGASRYVCSHYEGRELFKVTKWRACYDQALSAAVNNAQLESLQALHRKSDARENRS